MPLVDPVGRRQAPKAQVEGTTNDAVAIAVNIAYYEDSQSRHPSKHGQETRSNVMGLSIRVDLANSGGGKGGGLDINYDWGLVQRNEETGLFPER